MLDEGQGCLPFFFSCLTAVVVLVLVVVGQWMYDCFRDEDEAEEEDGELGDGGVPTSMRQLRQRTFSLVVPDMEHITLVAPSEEDFRTWYFCLSFLVNVDPVNSVDVRSEFLSALSTRPGDSPSRVDTKGATSSIRQGEDEDEVLRT